MELIEKDGIFLAITKFDERAIPKSAGFTWNNAYSRWETSDQSKATLLAEYAEVGLRDRLRQTVEAAIALSKATEVPQSVVDTNAGPSKSVEVPDLPKPEGLEYLPFQKSGIQFGVDHPNVLIADDMGLGKTVQAIGIYNADPSIRNVLIVCPASLTLNWKREFEKWGLRKPVVKIATSSHVPRSANVIVFNYDIAQKIRPQIDEMEWDLFISDESHMLKNGKAIRTLTILGGKKVETIENPNPRMKPRKRVTRFSPITARRRAFLTGTPILNRPVELWTLIHALDPDGLGSDWVEYVQRYCQGHKTKFGWDVSGSSNLEELQERLRSTFMIRRLKEDVLTELPGKRRVVLEIPATGTVVRIVEEEKRKADSLNEKIEQITAQAMMADAEGNEIAFRAAVRELRGAESLAFDEMSRIRHETAIAKIPHMIEHIDDSLETSPKIIVFAHHTDVIDALAKQYGTQCVTLTGQHSVTRRQAAVDRFQGDPSCRLIIAQIIAGGVGWTLTASSHVIFCELDWRPGIISQAEDRANRIGQKNMVLVQHLVFEGSIDAVMAQKIISKQEVISTALDAETISAFERRVEAAKNQEAETVVVAELAGSNNGQDRNLGHSVSARQTVDDVRRELDLEGFAITDEQCRAILYGLQFMTSSCDGARAVDGTGFNRMDAYMGRQLSMCAELTPRQAALGRRILGKYRRQLGDEMLVRMGIPRGQVEKLAVTA
ncbi:MAG: DEAD/DEAH box helicase [Candidatus Saccharimonadales bacterium]